MKYYLELFNFSNLLTVRNGFFGLAASLIGSVLTKVYGGELYLYFILCLSIPIVFDWISGSIASKKDGSYSSAYGLQGLFRTAVMISLPAWASLMDQLLGTPNVLFFIFWGGILFHTLISMSANFKRIGWNIWIPTWAIEWVASEIEAKIRRSNERVAEVMPQSKESGGLSNE